MSSFESISELNKPLENCTQKEFFTIETIAELNNTSYLFLRSNYYMLVISKIKPKNRNLFVQLLLSGDIHPNPGPPQVSQLSNIWKPFEKSGLHFIHININSLIPKIDEIKSIAYSTNAAIIGITESKLDEPVTNSELHINNYVLIRNDRNRKGGGVTCYVREDINFTQKFIFNDDIENIFINIKLNLLLLAFPIDHLINPNS